MACCPSCFVDVEIQAIIKDLSQGNTGTCDCCSKKDVQIVAIEDLLDYFIPLFNLYEETNDSTADCLGTTIQKEWHIFTNDVIAQIITQFLLTKHTNKR